MLFSFFFSKLIMCVHEWLHVSFCMWKHIPAQSREVNWSPGAWVTGSFEPLMWFLWTKLKFSVKPVCSEWSIQPWCLALKVISLLPHKLLFSGFHQYRCEKQIFCAPLWRRTLRRKVNHKFILLRKGLFVGESTICHNMVWFILSPLIWRY